MSKRRTLVKESAISQAGFRSDPLVVEQGDDAPDIAPALSDHEWAAWRGQRVNPVTMQREVSGFAPNPDNLWKTIAITNDQFHDEDPRKFCLRTIGMLQEAAMAVEATQGTETDIEKVRALGNLFSELHELSDVIASLLPLVGP